MNSMITNMIKAIIVLILTNNLVVNAAVNLCCTGDNEIRSAAKNCSDGTPLNIGACIKYILPKNETIATFDESDNMIFENGDYLEPEKYCYTKITNRRVTGKEVYIVCLPENTDSEALKIVILVFQFISVIFFFTTIVIYLMLPQMMDLQGICTIHSIFGLMIGYIVLISENISVSYDSFKCHLTAYALYFSFLYAFFWLHICCFNMWRLVVKPKIFKSINSWKLIYHLYGFGFPLIMLVLVALINHLSPPFLKSIHPGLTEGRCWFKSMRESLIYLYAPVSILLLVNIMFFIWTGLALWKATKSAENTSVMKYRLRLYISLFFIMGIQWIFEVISAAAEYFDKNKTFSWIWGITDSINALIGVIVFIILVVLRKKVIRSLANRSCFTKLIKFPASWRHVQDSECDDVEEEVVISMTACEDTVKANAN